MRKTGLLFSGQGAQAPNMGKDIYEKYDYVRDMFKEANQILGYKLEGIIFKDNPLLNQTKYTQASVLVVSLALYEVIRRELNIEANVLAGFSLGEYSALYANGIYNFSEIVDIVNKRANFMDEVAINNKGMMAAVIGLEKDILEDICDTVGNVWIANYNTPSQLVISGISKSVEEVIEIVTNDYKKRAIPLNVSGGFHSPLMINAASKLGEVLEKYNAKKPKLPMLMNYNAEELDFNNLKNALKLQVHSPVYFSDTISKMINDYNVDLFVEVGPGKVLSGFVKKIDRSKEVVNFEKLQDILNYKES